MEDTCWELRQMFQEWSPRLDRELLSVAAEAARREGAISDAQCKMCVCLEQAVNMAQCITNATAQNLTCGIRQALISKGRRLETQVQAAAQPGQSAHIDRDWSQILGDDRQLRGTKQAPASSQQVHHDEDEGHSQARLDTMVSVDGRAGPAAAPSDGVPSSAGSCRQSLSQAATAPTVPDEVTAPLPPPPIVTTGTFVERLEELRRRANQHRIANDAGEDARDGAEVSGEVMLAVVEALVQKAIAPFMQTIDFLQELGFRVEQLEASLKVQAELTAEIRPLEEHMDDGFAEMTRLANDVFRLSNLERAQSLDNRFSRESMTARLNALDDAQDDVAGRVTAVEAVLADLEKGKDNFAGRLAKIEEDVKEMDEAGHLLGQDMGDLIDNIRSQGFCVPPSMRASSSDVTHEPTKDR